MEEARIDLIFAMAPESICYPSGLGSHSYQAQSGKAFPPTSGFAFTPDWVGSFI